MPTGYTNNKDNRGLEEAREKRFKDEQQRIKKQHHQSDLAAKKGFLFSTKTTIDMKTSVMKSKEVRQRTLEGELRAIELKMSALDKKHKLELSAKTQTITQQLQKTELEISNLKREIETEKAHLVELVREEGDLKRKSEKLEVGNDGFRIRMELDQSTKQKEQKEREILAVSTEQEKLKREINQLEQDRIKLEAEVKKLESERI